MTDQAIKELREIIDDEEKLQKVLKVLQRERQNSKESRAKRQAEGIAAAKERGVKFGRPQKPLSKKFMKLYESYTLGLITITEASALLGVPRSSFRRMIDRYEEQLEKNKRP